MNDHYYFNVIVLGVLSIYLSILLMTKAIDNSSFMLVLGALLTLINPQRKSNG